MRHFKHPKHVCMTYCNHCVLSMYFSYILLIASMKAFIHAIYPDIFITSTSDSIKKIQKLIESNGCAK